ncbi:MAG: hypothetical protein ABEN55_11410 [Bradymonadaceae bacterium]
MGGWRTPNRDYKESYGLEFVRCERALVDVVEGKLDRALEEATLWCIRCLRGISVMS